VARELSAAERRAAAGVAFAVSPDAAWVTGTTIDVAGGLVS